jgi:uncharacterized protein
MDTHEPDLRAYLAHPCTAFAEFRQLASGPLIDVVLAAKEVIDRDPLTAALVFDDVTGRALEFDLRGTRADLVARLSQQRAPIGRPAAAEPPAATDPAVVGAAEPRGRGRPRMGVVGREITLLPRQWEWLAAQPGGASVVIRKLVDEAKRTGGAVQKSRAAQEAAYRFMSAVAGDLPGYEEATRALFAGNRARFETQVSQWPESVRAYAARLAFGGTTSA